MNEVNDVRILVVPKTRKNPRVECFKMVKLFCQAADVELEYMMWKDNKSDKLVQKLKSMLMGMLYDDFMFQRKVIAEVFIIDPSSVTHHVQKNRRIKLRKGYANYYAMYERYSDVYNEILEEMIEKLTDEKEPSYGN